MQTLKRDDGASNHMKVIDKKNIHNNRLQVIDRYVLGKADDVKYDNHMM